MVRRQAATPNPRCHFAHAEARREISLGRFSCIVQDDAASQESLIGKLDISYTNAVCTIIAHGNVDASSRIPGVRPGTRQLFRPATTEAEPGEGIQLVASPPHYSTCLSVYDTRGWTYQE